jgi:hypothetical protein
MSTRLLLALALLPLGACSPSTPDRQAARALPAVPANPGSSAIAVSPSSPLPDTNAPTPPAVATPAWSQGAWEPYSRGYMALKTLTVAAHTVDWQGCKAVPLAVSEQDDDTVLLAIDPGTPCLLNDIPPSQVGAMRLTRRDGACEIGVAMFTSVAAARSNDMIADGIYGRARCAGR